MSNTATEEKLGKLRGILRAMDGVVLAYSGGVDSTFLLKVATDELGDRVLAVTATSPTYTHEEYEGACEIARSLGVRHVSISTDELADANFCRNSPQRCYHCKTELFRKLRDIADGEGMGLVLDASNRDDCVDYRPGRRAAEEAGVRSPLVEAGLSKDDIRALSRDMDLPTWDKAAMACLASRFPYGEIITAEKLSRVERAEKLLRDLGFREVRVRSHGVLARIEVEGDGVGRLAEPELRRRIAGELKALGFVYVTLDLEGYRTGSLNETLRDEDILSGRVGSE